MLEEILQSKQLTNILGFFLLNSDRAFYVGDLQKRLGRSVHRHLFQLAKMDLLRTFSKKNQRFFMLNARSKELPEVKNKIVKASKKYPEDDLLKAIRQMPKIKLAVLCGVFNGNPELDCDLLLVGEISKKRLEGFVKMAEKSIGQELNYALFDSKEYELRRNMFDRFIKDIYENPHTMVVNKIR